MYFEKLPQNYQDAINKAIKEDIGKDTPEIAQAFREWEAEGLLGCEISERDNPPERRLAEFNINLCAFEAGWLVRPVQPVMI